MKTPVPQLGYKIYFDGFAGEVKIELARLFPIFHYDCFAMHSPISVFNRILIGNLSPWLPDNQSDDRYAELSCEITEHSYAFQPLYAVRFLNPVFPKRKYYAKLIEEAAAAYFNRLHSNIEKALTEDHKRYLLDTALKKELRPLIHQAAQVIAGKNLDLEALTNLTQATKTDRHFADSIYVLQLLKFQLIWLYQEVQDRYKNYTSGYYLTVEDMLLFIFKEDPLQNKFITPVEPAYSLKLPDPLIVVEREEAFKAKQGDVKPFKKGILTYDEIVEDRNRFASLELNLYQRKMIDKEYSFLEKPHGNKVRMAAVYHLAFRKGLFKKKKFPGARPITIDDVQAFLNYRYTTNIRKQFTEFKRLPHTLTQLLEKDPGLEYAV